MRVAIVHDYLTQRGGAERVVLAAARGLDCAEVHALAYDAESTFAEFQDFAIRTTWLDHVLPRRLDLRVGFALMPLAVKSIRIPSNADVVLVSSSGWAHGIRCDQPVVVYCHTPPRWVHAPEDYASGMPWPARVGVRVLGGAVRGWDARAAIRATTYLANSRITQERVHVAYGRNCKILQPPPGITAASSTRAVPGLRPGYVLAVSRPRGYKNLDAIVAAVIGGTEHDLVVVGAPEIKSSARVHSLGKVSDPELAWLYANAMCLAAFGQEDFGLTPIEAGSFGTPTVALAAGGYLETVSDGETGFLVHRESPAALAQGIRRVAGHHFDAESFRRQSLRFSEERFIDALISELQSALDPSPRSGAPPCTG